MEATMEVISDIHSDQAKLENKMAGFLAVSTKIFLQFLWSNIFWTTEDPRFSDTKFSDNPWYSDSFAADHFLI